MKISGEKKVFKKQKKKQVYLQLAPGDFPWCLRMSASRQLRAVPFPELSCFPGLPGPKAGKESRLGPPHRLVVMNFKSGSAACLCSGLPRIRGEPPFAWLQSLALWSRRVRRALGRT